MANAPKAGSVHSMRTRTSVRRVEPLFALVLAALGWAACSSPAVPSSTPRQASAPPSANSATAPSASSSAVAAPTKDPSSDTQQDEKVDTPVYARPALPAVAKQKLTFKPANSKGTVAFVAARAYKDGDGYVILGDTQKRGCTPAEFQQYDQRWSINHTLWPNGTWAWEDPVHQIWFNGEENSPKAEFVVAKNQTFHLDEKTHSPVDGTIEGQVPLIFCGPTPLSAGIAKRTQSTLVFEIAGQKLTVEGAMFRKNYGLSFSTAPMTCSATQYGIAFSSKTNGRLHLEGLPAGAVSWKVARQNERFKAGTPEKGPNGENVIPYDIDFETVARGYPVKIKGRLLALDCDNP